MVLFKILDNGRNRDRSKQAHIWKNDVGNPIKNVLQF